MNNQNQSYANHQRMHPLFHYVLSLLAIILLVSSLTQLVSSIRSGNQIFLSFIFVLISIMLIIIFLLIRSYPMKAQDRAIRAEENLRHYVLTQKLLDSKLSLKQIIALRFASDAELPALAQRAAAEQMSPDAIKKSIQQWRSDYFRI
ncbi:DUF6526 family protein [Paenibacillus sp. GP183]|uniref:DUF6526 family protein n=1 Tax=Paenibacillus sp. GP183 TaxID=1882751 RepID=UPI0008996494|nr:DUF6526 family protein [Paenibacillus sp. GP183]SEC46969.1 hypothetical protein SAMN05443246_4210 [Paenibacillus sp. GP183]